MTMELGRRLRLGVYGSSHGPEVGLTLEGLPRGTPVDLAAIRADLDRRRPVGRRLATRRHEEDALIVDRGVVDGRADGGTFQAHVLNTDVRREPYDKLRDIPRPGHADYPARVRYGEQADLSGGGIFSGRMTVGLVVAGALAKGLLARLSVEVVAFTRSIGPFEAPAPEELGPSELARRSRGNEVGSADPAAAEKMEAEIGEARRAGDSLGGVVEVRAFGVPVGLGEPFFDSLESVLAHAYFSVPAVKAVEFGAGFAGTRMRGSEHNDPFVLRDGEVRTVTNHAGGILGGLATGMPIVARIAVKPASSIAHPQRTLNTRTGEQVDLVVTGRHDPCIVPRAVVVLEAMTAFALADLALEGGTFRDRPPADYCDPRRQRLHRSAFRAASRRPPVVRAPRPWCERALRRTHALRGLAARRDSPPALAEETLRPLSPAELARRRVDVVFSALPSGVAGATESELVRRGVSVFSNASDHRTDPRAALLVPEVNAHRLENLPRPRGGRGLLVANPNCSAAGLVVALAPIVPPLRPKAVHVSTYQALSGAGYPGVPSLSITNNVLPFIREEEEKLAQESAMLLGSSRGATVLPLRLPILAHCARVGTRDGHLEAVTVEASRRPELPRLLQAWAEFDPLAPYDLPSAPSPPILVRSESDRPQPLRDRWAGAPVRARGMAVTVGRVRWDPPYLRFFVLSHNAVRGGAGGSVLNAELAVATGRLNGGAP